MTLHDAFELFLTVLLTANTWATWRLFRNTRAERDAIAMEARQGGDACGSMRSTTARVPQDIAHPIPCDPTTPKQEGPNV